MSEQEIIEAYFNEPAVVVKLNLELGFSGRVEVDWERRTITARGTKSGREWDLDEMLDMLRREV